MKKYDFNKDFELPEYYFEQNQKDLFLKSGADFKVPSGYFENQREELLNRGQKKKFQIKFNRVAIAASLIILFGIAFQFLNTKSAQNNSANNEAYETVSELYLEPEKNPEIEDMDLLEEYFGDLQDVYVASGNKEISNPENTYNIQDSSKEQPLNQELSKEEEQVNEVLYDLFINEKPSSEEEDLEEEDYYL